MGERFDEKPKALPFFRRVFCGAMIWKWFLLVGVLVGSGLFCLSSRRDADAALGVRWLALGVPREILPDEQNSFVEWVARMEEVSDAHRTELSDAWLGADESLRALDFGEDLLDVCALLQRDLLRIMEGGPGQLPDDPGDPHFWEILPAAGVSIALASQSLQNGDVSQVIEHPDFSKDKARPKDLDYYQSVPNGFLEIVEDCSTISDSLPLLVGQTIDVLTKTSFAWLRAEAGGVEVKSLRDLVPQYLDEVPLDPADGEPLRLLPGKRVIYSIGIDLKDSKGTSKDALTEYGWIMTEPALVLPKRR